MKVSTDRIVSVSAMVVGVGSLFVILYQTHLMRQAQHASVLPYVMIAVNSDAEGAYLTARNAGIGPALIEDVRIHYQNRTIQADPYDFFIGVRPDRNLAGLSVDKMIPGRLIPAGEAVRMLGMGAPDGPRMLDDIIRLFEVAEVPRSWLANSGVPLSGAGRAVVEITYRSIYGDRWRVRSDRIVPDEAP